MSKRSLFFFIATLLIIMAAASMASAKKLILDEEFNYTLPSVLSSEIGNLQDKPFDGMILRLKVTDPTVFTKTRWSDSSLYPEYGALQTMRWGRLTDNFLLVTCASNIDWFNDNDWASVLYNIGLVAKAARLGHCKGIVFDPESAPDYTTCPFCYAIQSQHAYKSFNDYRAIVRKRSAQFLNAIKAQLPYPVIHFYYGYEVFAHDMINPNMNSTALSNHEWGLLPSFINGMLDAATSGTVINDGNEESYYYKSPTDYTSARSRILGSNASLAAPDLTGKYMLYVRNAPALYVDYIYNQFDGPFTWRPNYSQYMTPTQRNLWWEHNVYYALQTSSNYVWCYAEHANFIRNQNIPTGLLDATSAAEQLLNASKPLGYSMDPIITPLKIHFPGQ